MISNDKRKIVAANLRQYLKKYETPDWRAFCNIILGSGRLDNLRKAQAFDRLADLIDVPTTVLDLTETTRTVHGECVRGWECRECGQSCEEMYGEYEYCPHCGRKVVEP